jgi:two-component system cell cycle sensor histidine kinase/response regulator CckA
MPSSFSDSSIPQLFANLDGDVQVANRALLALLGPSDGPLVGRPVSALVTDAGFHALHAEWQRLVEGSELPGRLRIELETESGVEVRELLLVRLPGGAGGEPQIHVQILPVETSAWDVETRRRERALEVRLELVEASRTLSLSELLTRSLDVIGEIVESPIGFYHFVQPDQRTLTLQQWSSRTLSTFCHVEAFDAHYDLDDAGVWADCVRERRAIVHNDYASLPNKRGLPPGHAKLVRQMVVPVMRRGKVVAVLGVGNRDRDYDDGDLALVSYLADVTWQVIELKRAEEAAVDLDRKLQRAQRMEAIGQLAGGVAHDFNNLLTIVRTYSNFLLEALPEDSPLEADVLEILSASGRASELTQQLLAYGRGQVLELSDVDLNEMVGSTVRMLDRVVGDGVALETHLRENLPLVRIDVSQIEQVLMNLVVNARDALHGRGRISVETDQLFIDEAGAEAHPGARAGRYVMLSVRDDGAGIPPDVLDHVFEPFFSTKGSQGTGLGLALVYGIVHQSGGFVSVLSEVGIGTAFKVFLPPATGSDPPPGPVEVAENEPLEGTETLLLVEDDSAVRRAAVRILERAGYTVLPVPTPAEALAKIDALGTAVDLVLTDMEMVGMTGTELAAALQDRFPDLAVVFMSGYTEASAKAGAYFVQKPFDSSSLLREIRAALGASRGPA